MKTIRTIKLLVSFLWLTNLCSQDLENILLAKDDAQILAGAYLAPAFKGLIYSMNNGWYHTAKVHKKFGFDISIGANAAFVPSKDEIFNLAALNLSEKTSVTNGLTSSPTLAGSNNISPAELEYTTTLQGQDVSVDFTLPEGVKEDLPISAVPAPVVQVSLGLPFKLDAIVRYVPKVGSDDVKAGLFGLGVKKEITDWLGVLGKTPLHISVLAAYSNMSVDYNIDTDEAESGNVITRNASAEFGLNTFSLQAIASLNFPIINLYGGLGYNTGSVKLNMLGSYELFYQPSDIAEEAVSETITDPVSLKTSTGSLNATLGARISLGFFKIYGSYTLQEYNTLNAGIAFSIR
ncbi:MAG: DUF6588 family protein [Tenacibaculum sp.]